MSEDTIYKADTGSEPFRFDDKVAAVFPDMLRRSIPGYAASIEAIGSLARRYVRAGSNCYDLGCSLGAATIAMRQGINEPGCRIVAVDTAPAMIERGKEIVANDTSILPVMTDVDFVLGDIRDIEIVNASMVVLNYTLQFLPPEDRDSMLRRIYEGMNDGGLLVLSEKVIDENPHMEELLVDLHHEHKRRNDYSALEISRKRAALENVLVPETVPMHRARLKEAGFAHSAVWLRYFNFVSIIAIR
ncbi:MAG: carboxy-S-adenosyl-L-methionine synthase CmoA [Gammaproteobacteria bacterium]|nr:carboxy-S-adenosyl-L-methionine synthase CmoA [Gammaproteobacteria bacterium]MBU2678224.1 carboxy-S-adenosyl-L-methionine synthase CmoA [Gammaproteobacteria bacterium]NNC56071.1 carboxy-S-adenosyl-L-methionine synthase CmoA [Woeseiaceae bacterium]NNL51959.1 carboxy-S-adenosyl-L-methionine synthase CmoA [Woeseiaceae bacterium]